MVITVYSEDNVASFLAHSLVSKQNGKSFGPYHKVPLDISLLKGIFRLIIYFQDILAHVRMSFRWEMQVIAHHA